MEYLSEIMDIDIESQFHYGSIKTKGVLSMKYSWFSVSIPLWFD